DHPYGNPTVGTIRGVKAITREAIRTQYDRLFRAENLVIVGAGDALPHRFKTWGEELERLRPGGEKPVDVAEPALPESRRLHIVDKPGRTQTWVFESQTGIHPSNPAYIPLYIANHAFGGSFTARLMEEIRVKRGWSHG